MNKCIWTFVVISISFMSLAVSAQAPSITYLALTADENHSICSISGGYSFPEFFTMYIWVLPSYRGLISAKLGIRIPPLGVGLNETTMNPILCEANYYGGTYVNNFDVTFCECQTDWIWIAKKVIVIGTQAVDNSFIQIIGFSHGPISVLNCESESQLEETQIWTHLYINGPCVIGTSEHSWGAIKSMYR